MPIDIDHLTEAELVDLNHRVVERLRFLHQMRSHKRMLDFRIGGRVSFQSQTGAIVTGVLTRYNKKSVTVVADTGERWNVSPNLLQPVAERAQGGAPTGADAGQEMTALDADRCWRSRTAE